MKHVRITFNSLSMPDQENLLLEYGRMGIIGLDPEERAEYDELDKEFKDAPEVAFNKAKELLDPKKKAEILRRRRYVELDKKLVEPQMIWMPVEAEETPESILLILRSRFLPVYVENLPQEMIQRLMEPTIHINNPTIYTQPPPQQPQVVTQPALAPPAQQPPAQQPPAQAGANPRDRILGALRAIKEPNTFGKTWDELVIVDEKNPAEGIYENEVSQAGRIYIQPAKFLGDDWKRTGDTINAVFGASKVNWKNQFKKQSHWEVVLVD